MTDSTYDTRQLTGRTAVDRNYSKIGTINDVDVDDVTGEPAWLAVKTGLFGTRSNFVPLSGAEVVGDDVVVPYDTTLVKDAPQAETDEHLDPDEERALYAHYGLNTTGWDPRRHRQATQGSPPVDRFGHQRTGNRRRDDPLGRTT